MPKSGTTLSSSRHETFFKEGSYQDEAEALQGILRKEQNHED
jgi:hypothetical protein